MTTLYVPNIGDFKDVPIIEILMKEGQIIEADQSLITIESDKASMEVPATAGGKIKQVLVKLGDKVSQGSPLALLEDENHAHSASSQASPPAQTIDATSQSAVAPQTLEPTHVATVLHAEVATKVVTLPLDQLSADILCDVLVIGSGPGGYSAAFRAADLGLKVVLVEKYPTLGGVCLNVGCIPSKAYLHVANLINEVKHLSQAGVEYADPKVNLTTLRQHKHKVVTQLTQGLGSMAKLRKVQVLQGYAEFLDKQRVCVHEKSLSPMAGASVNIVGFRYCIIAAGSEAIELPFFPKDDKRVVTSTGALNIPFIPKKMLVVGGGIIGMEMATVYSTLGARIEVVEAMDDILLGTDRDIIAIWKKYNQNRFDQVLLKTKTVNATVTSSGIQVHFEDSLGKTSQKTYDLVLQAVGRRPNGKTLAAEKAEVQVNERGFISVDIQMRTNVGHIFAIGDIVGQPMLAHKAVHEGHIAAEVIAGELLADDKLAKRAFEARAIPSVAYLDPEIAWVGLTEDQAKKDGIPYKKGVFPWAANGRSIANMRTDGMTKLIFDASPEGHGQILGACIVGPHAGDLIAETGLAIEMGADMLDIAATIHAHPTLSETVGMAAEVAHGSCTDLPPTRKMSKA
ncbi:MAG: dihydrolipoyl dehydrogenase [Gammaproteobacteria bacterium]|nr:dihydrolipoyl dehydrogenase [Gammaproteobacteria bacterium]